MDIKLLPEVRKTLDASGITHEIVLHHAFTAPRHRDKFANEVAPHLIPGSVAWVKNSAFTDSRKRTVIFVGDPNRILNPHELGMVTGLGQLTPAPHLGRPEIVNPFMFHGSSDSEIVIMDCELDSYDWLLFHLHLDTVTVAISPANLSQYFAAQDISASGIQFRNNFETVLQ